MGARRQAESGPGRGWSQHFPLAHEAWALRGGLVGRQLWSTRWQENAKDGHGGNKLLRGCRKEDLEFSILQRVGPDMPAAEVIEIEGHWKQRLHTRAPYGLNDN